MGAIFAVWKANAPDDFENGAKTHDDENELEGLN